MRRRQKKWRSAGEDILVALTELGLPEIAAKVRIQLAWESAVGQAVATQAQPDRFERGTLTVRVRTATWQNELTFMQAQIIDRLNAALGKRLIRELHIVAGTLAQRRAPQPLPAADSGDLARSEDAARVISDDELRAQFRRMMEASYRASRAAGKRPNLRR